VTDGAVVDTDVVSFLVRRDSRAHLYLPHLQDRLLVISFMTLAELQRWVLRYNWGQRRQAILDTELQRYIIDWPDAELCERWAEVMAQAERAGRPMAGADAWQAATALLNDVPLISHNRRHFAGVPGLTLISEAPA
jgi:tRNA(fMet)-specific endonuclease VapC